MTNQIVSFDDVLMMLMIEESEPTPEALARWQKRYPQHRTALAEFFETWATQAKQTEPVELDVERIAAEGVRRVLEAGPKPSPG